MCRNAFDPVSVIPLAARLVGEAISKTFLSFICKNCKSGLCFPFLSGWVVFPHAGALS